MYNATLQDHINRITIRAGGPRDDQALRRLAGRDSSKVPDGDLLIALVDGEARAAVSLSTGATIADPFHRTAELVGMLRLRSSELQASVQGRDSAAARRRAPGSNRPVAATIPAKPCLRIEAGFAASRIRAARSRSS
jgi:hypothetical protein